MSAVTYDIVQALIAFIRCLFLLPARSVKFPIPCLRGNVPFVAYVVLPHRYFEVFVCA